MVVRHRRTQQITPFPELIRERGELRWEVEEASPGESSCWIDKKQTLGRLKVPYGNEYCETCQTNHPHNVRQHELLHAKISPAQGYRTSFKASGVTYDVPIQYIQLAEEQRVHDLHAVLARKTGQTKEWAEKSGTAIWNPDSYHAYTIACDTDAKEYISETYAENGLFDLMTYLFALPQGQALTLVAEKIKEHQNKIEDAERFLDTPAVELNKKHLKAWVQINAALRVVSRYKDRKNMKQWTNVLKLAELIRLTIQKLDDENVFDLPRPGQIDMEEDLKKAQQRNISRFAGVGRVELKDLSRLVDNIPKQSATASPYDYAGMPESEGGNIWAEMELITPPLTKRLNPLKNKRKARASNEGAVPRYMHRWATDQAVFNSTTKEPGGTVLIDCSGSMSLSTQDIVEIMEAAPAATIATYCGAGTTGELRIVAHKGKRVDERKHKLTGDMGGNQVDLPALQWLANQPEPRLWVSDGYVFCVKQGNMMTPWEECEALVRKARINKVEEPENARDAFLGKRKLYR